MSEIVKRLKALREEFERDGLDILYHSIPVALVLFDVCQTLDLTEEECQEVLGQEVAEAIEQWLDCRIQLKEDP